MGFLTGAVYGGFIHSRLAYLNFMDNNQATAFKSHFDAKVKPVSTCPELRVHPILSIYRDSSSQKKLQDLVTINFAKGAFKWGWRLGLFTSAYV